MHEYMRTYIHTYLLTYILIYIHINIHTHTHTYVRTYVHTYTHISMYCTYDVANTALKRTSRASARCANIQATGTSLELLEILCY